MTHATQVPATKVAAFLSGGKARYPEPGWWNGRERPLIANEVLCSCPGTCGFRENGQCLLCPYAFKKGDSPYRWNGLMRCPYGTLVSTRGYTHRSRRYAEFKARCEADATYGALQGTPVRHTFCPVGEHVLVRMKTICIERTCDTDGYITFGGSRPTVRGTPIGLDGQLTVFPLMHDEPSWVGGSHLVDGNWYASPGTTGETWLERELVDVNVIKDLCEFKHPDMSAVSKFFDLKSARPEYRATVYAMLDNLHRYWPEMYLELKGCPPRGIKLIY